MKTSQVPNQCTEKQNSHSRHEPLQRIVPRACRIALLLVLLLTACTNPATPAPPGPPSTANGQAILGWGGNSSGQIGDGTTNQRLAPATVLLADVRAITAGGDYSLALTAGGGVLEWGGGRTSPAEVSGLGAVKQIAAGERHRLALQENGTVWAWGDNNRGQLGDGSNTARSTPVQVVGLSNVLGIAAGGEHSLAILGDFSVMAWGANNLGQLGSNSPTDQLTPVAVPGIKAIEVAASSIHSLALTTDANVMGWGGNDACQLGIDPPPDGEPITQITCSDHPEPTLVFSRSAPPRPSTTGHAIAATNSLTLIVLSDGSVYGMGGQDDPAQGQLRGICNPDAVFGPAQLFSLSGTIKEVAGGDNHALFLMDTGEVWALGANLAGQIGTGSTSVQECPREIPATSVRGASSLAAGKEHSLALIRGALSASQSLVDFGNHPYGAGSPASQDVTLSNSGLAPATLYNFGVSGLGDYSLTENCPDPPGTLAPNGSCRITVSFAPAAPGQRDGRITVTHDAQGQTLEIALTGRGTEAKVTFLPATIDFGTQATGTTGTAQTVTIQNTGEAPLLINQIEATAGFTLSNDACDKNPLSVPAQGTCTVQVAFSPNVTGPAVGELRVDYEPNNQLAILRLEGRGN